MTFALAQWISERLLQSEAITEAHIRFQKNKPFPHILLPDFINSEKFDLLSDALLREQFHEKEADLFHFKQTDDLHHSKKSIIKDFVALLSTKEFAMFMKSLTSINVKPGAFDLSGTLYESTHYLLCHDDQLEGRKIAYILYLSDDFEEEDGGALALLADDSGRPGKIVQRYFPLKNTLMIFEVSPTSWHEVEEVLSKRKRYAIGGWLH